jgi:hypothetical protein
MRKHEREMMSTELVLAKDEWEHRDHHTVAQDIGHLGQETYASKHHHDKKDADHTPEGEAIAYMRLHERQLLGAELTKAKDEWEHRDHHTVAQDIGHLGQETYASKHHHDKKDADHTPEGEAIAYMRLHGRKLMSQELAKAKSEWENRDHHTVAQDIGHLGVATEASKHHHDKQDADHTPEAEHIAYLRVHERQLMSQELKKEHEAFDKRTATNKANELKKFQVSLIA